MLFITNKSTNPHYNLALEEYVLKHLNIHDSIVILWQNEPSVIIGRNQNTIEEINSNYIKEKNIHVVRRLSGGGAVYHDLGNLNFTFITNKSKDNVSNFQEFTKPVIEALNELGVPAQFTGRNDITIEGKKFSGNAQYSYKNRLLHHGTILFNSDLSVVQEALNVKVEKVESKGVKSVRSRVTNILPYLKNPLNLEEFIDILTKSLFQYYNQEINEYLLTDEDNEKINRLMEERYTKWEWNFGESPAYTLQKTKRYPGGNLDMRLDVKKGRINGCKIYGDYFGEVDTEDLIKALLNKKYDESEIVQVLNQIDFSKYFTHISKEEFIDCMFN